MEKKPNITPTPWKCIKFHPAHNNTYLASIITADGFDFEITFPTSMSREEARVIIDRMVTAVNCTYGANLNPEKIQDVIDALKDCLRQLNEGCNTFYEIEQYKRANDKNIKALNNIKYKD